MEGVELTSEVIDRQPKTVKEQPLQNPEASILRRFRNRVNRVFEGEKNPPELPPISVDIVFAPHVTSADKKNIKAKFKKADIYIPEMVAWTGLTLRTFNHVSRGEESPEEALKLTAPISNSTQFPETRREELEMIYYSGKPITSIDIPLGHELTKEYLRFLSEDESNVEYRSFEEILNKVKQNSKTLGEINRAREDYMVSQITPRIQEVLKNDPRLRQKHSLRVLISLGAAHTRVFHSLKDQGVAVSRQFEWSPYLFSYAGEGIRRYLFEKEIDDELAAKILLQEVVAREFGNNFSKLTKYSSKVENLKRKIVSQFSFDEIKDMFDVSTSSKWGDLEQASGERFRVALERKNIRIPKTAKGLDQMLK